MRRRKSFVAIAVVVLCGLMAREVSADETDNFTCRSRPMRDALEQLDALMNARIRKLSHAPTIGPAPGAMTPASSASRVTSCERDRQQLPAAADVDSALQVHEVGQRPSRSRSLPPEVQRDHLRGALLHRLWMYPFHRRIIFVADSIRLAGRIVGLDKMDHFIREGLVHWRAVNEKGGTIASDIARELGSPTRRIAWTEQGLKGMALTGVLAYADLAASYSGFRFWSDLLAVGTPQSFVELELATGRLHQIRAFTFASYVNDAWDETINRSKLAPKLRQEVDETIRRRGLSPGGDCRHLAALPDASLFVNPECLPAGATIESRH